MHWGNVEPRQVIPGTIKQGWYAAAIDKGQ